MELAKSLVTQPKETVQGMAKKYTEAEAAYKKAIEIKPDFAEAYNGLANVYNAENREFTIPDYRCRGSVPVRGIPFLPILGIKGMF